MIYEKLCRGYMFKQENEVQQLADSFLDLDLKDVFDSLSPLKYFVCADGGLPKGDTFHVIVVRTNNNLYAYHNQCILRFDGISTHQINCPEESDWKTIFLEIGFKNIETLHYEYLDLVLKHFWHQVFDVNSREHNSYFGLPTAHGDKAYGYKRLWMDQNIPFNHGVMLFLLSYSSEFGDNQRDETDAWVIKNYQHYLPMILKAEKIAEIGD